jgi:uncharacterized protein with beta-barrel porin domain
VSSCAGNGHAPRLLLAASLIASFLIGPNPQAYASCVNVTASYDNPTNSTIAGICVTSSVIGTITNEGTVSPNGISIGGPSFFGSVTNSGNISSGPNQAGINIGASSFSGSVINGGLISAADIGILLENVTTFSGGIANSGTIDAGSIGSSGNQGIRLEGVKSFSGGINNTGVISTVGSGILADNVLSFTNGITNSGTISAGQYGICLCGFIGGGSFSGGIVNQSTGIIMGGTGGIAVSSVAIFANGITNAGTISAGGSNVAISVTSDPTFSGGITNTGTITGYVGIAVGNSQAVSIFDSGIVVGNGGTAIDLSNNSSGNTVTLGPGYSITGKVIGSGSDTFQLGGTGNGAFNLSSIGGSNQYQGFTAFNVVSGIWAVTGTFGQMQTWNVLGGTLSGDGTLNSVNVSSGGTLAPGNHGAPGTSMTIAGNLAFSPGANYQVYLNALSSTFANAGGTASLAGTVSANFAPNISPAKSYVILQSAGLNGTTFSGINTTGLPTGFTSNLDYSANDVFLNVSAAISQTGLSVNQRNIAQALNNFFNNGGTLPSSYSTTFNLTGTNLANALSQLDGETAVDARRGAFNMMNDFLSLMLDPFAGGRVASDWPVGRVVGFAPERDGTLPSDLALAYETVLKAPPKTASFDQRWTVWGTSFGGGSMTNGDPIVGSNTVSARTFGFAGGLDYHVTPNTVYGIAFAGGGTNWDLARGLGGGRSDALQAGIYGATRSGPAYLAASIAFADHAMTTDRFAPDGDEITARFNAQTYGVRAEAGYRYPSVMTLYAALQMEEFHTPGYSETDLTGGGLGLSYSSTTAVDVRSELGARFDKLTLLGSMPLILRARLAWAHDWATNPSLDAAFQGLPGASFIVNGAPIPKNSALTSVSAQLNLAIDWSLSGKFTSEFAPGSQTYAGLGALRYSW